MPLLSYVFIGDDLTAANLRIFLYSCILTGVALSIVGALKSFVTEKNILIGILETVSLDGIAAFSAYYTGDVLEKIVLNI